MRLNGSIIVVIFSVLFVSHMLDLFTCSNSNIKFFGELGSYTFITHVQVLFEIYGS